MDKKTTAFLKTEFLIAQLLRYGVLLCGAIVLMGIILAWMTPHSLDQFAKETLPRLASGNEITNAAIPMTPSEVLSQARDLHPNAVITLGLILLITLPILRVGATVVLFLIEKDYLYFSITLFVFCVLLSSILLGKAL